MESSQLYAATLTHYSTEPLTTGPDYVPLLLLLALDGDVHPNPGPSRYPCLVCLKNVTSQGTSYLCTRCSHWVHSRCNGLRNAVDYRKANGWICTACMTPPPSHTHLHHHLVPPTMSDKSFNILHDCLVFEAEQGSQVQSLFLRYCAAFKSPEHFACTHPVHLVHR